MGPVVELVRYPLKSAHGEQLRYAVVDPGGLRGDREWACLDEVDGTVGSAKHPRRWGRLLMVRAVRGGSEDDPVAPVAVHVAGTAWQAGSEQADEALSVHLGRPIRLSRVVPPSARLHRLLPDQRGLTPDWMRSLKPGDEAVTDVTGARPGGRFVDFGAVHLVSTGALDRLARRLGRPAVAAARFRPNLVIDAPADPTPGTELRLGDVVLRVLVPTPRCIVPGLERGPTPVDHAMLSTLARHHRTELPGLGRAACFGVYAEVVHPGRVHRGQHAEWISLGE